MLVLDMRTYLDNNAHMEPFLQILVFAFFAGCIATGIGGGVGVIIKKPSKKYIALMFAFAAGTMLGIVFIELLPEAQEVGGLVHTCIGLGLGAIFIFVINRLDAKANNKIENMHDLFAREGHEHKKLFVLGLIIMFAIMLHDFPEGLAIGAAGRVDASLTTGILILLHNIPEGMIMALPLKASGAKSWKVVGICFLAGIPTILGAMLGFAIGINDILIAYSLAIACGAMLCLVFVEMLPTTYEYHTNRKLQTAVIIAGAVFALVLQTII